MTAPPRNPDDVPGHPAPRPRRAASEASGHWAVAIGQDNLGTIQTGDHATAVTLPYEALRPAAEVDAPPGLDDLRHRPHRFVGRAVELDRLDAALTPPGGAVVQAVHGLGGVGKSALASHWAATRAHGCFPIRWINADSQANVQQGLADLATALQPALARVLSVELLAERALQWLATHTGWLLILDNVEDPADIAPLTDGLTTGRLLITSRLATTWNHVTTVIRLDVLDPAESLELLTRILTADGPRGPDGSAELCAEVGHFPLAIEQAASYLVENRLTTPTPRAYLDLLARYPADMYRDAGVTTGAERTIARVWRLTLDRITTAHPLAGDLLRTLAWYAPDHIPMTLLDGFGPPPALNRALGLLTAYSMVTPAPDTGGLSVHRLVQAFARTPDPDDPHRTGEAVDRAREHAVGRLAAAFPGDGNDPVTWPAWRGLLPHIDTLLDHGAETSDTLATAGLLNGAGVFLLGQGLCTRALEPLRRALAGTERLLGADHPNTLTARNNLAAAYESAGDLDRAVSLHTGNLTRRARVLGVSHPSTLISRNNLAGAYEAAGRVDEAIVLYEGNLADLAQVLGPAHPHTLAAKNNLAGAYETAGDLNRAVVLYEQNLEDCARALGSDHPDTLMYRNNLSGAYKSGGDPGRAIPLFERNLDDQIRVLGSDHADVLSSRNNLATAYAAVGDLDRAVPLLVRNLADRTRILGADHPAALTSRHNLARAYQDGGDLDRALPLLERNLDDRVRLLGPDHPDTLTSRDSLAGALQDGGDLDRALPLLERNLDDRVRLLGPDHPDTLTSR
ncbi:tetratricopeptide repeat protein, partial [Streptomyces sp. NPDC097619]|uniref:tetratricopeptide repeat protein n=1 Tax=Streptomyces sp. NPDC097619 TaxID=3157228 RepID=UPI00331E6250